MCGIIAQSLQQNGRLTLSPAGNRAVVQVFEGTSGIDVKKVDTLLDFSLSLCSYIADQS